MDLITETNRRRTFAIISHPDAGKTTLTEKLLLMGGAIALAGTIKARKTGRHATSDWMEMEKQRGISITTSVMQFPYQDCIINLLDTPGHADFSEDTYRTLTAVDSALMVIDAAKGVEDRTIKLLEICRMRQTPVITFINKLDRDSRPPLELLDEIEKVLKIQCAPITWPIGMGRDFCGTYHLLENCVYLYPKRQTAIKISAEKIQGLDDEALQQIPAEVLKQVREEVELLQMANHPFNKQQYLSGQQTPVFFGSAMNNFGVKELLDALRDFAPPPQARATQEREVSAGENKFTGFVFKIQANMDPAHHDRVAFVRICSGHYRKGIRVKHVQKKREITLHNAMTFMAGEREQLDTAFPGDIIGLHAHGNVHIGDSFSEGEDLHFLGIPYFAPELFKIIRLKDPLKAKALQKGIQQLSEEGAVQVFKPLDSNELIVGAIGSLQFDVVAYRLQQEYGVQCSYETTAIVAARWVYCADAKILAEFKSKLSMNLALDVANCLTYLAQSKVNLNLTMERWPKIQFQAIREHQNSP